MTIDGPGGRRPRPAPPGSRAGGPRKLVTSLSDAAARIGAEGAFELAALGRQWAGIVGDDVAAHAWPLSLRNGALTLGTDHHAWASQLRLLSGDLMARVRLAGFVVGSVAVQVSPGEGRGW